MTKLRADATLEEAKAWLREHVDVGERCPCCTQLAKVYRRKLYAGVARELICLWRNAGTEFAHWPTIHARVPGLGGSGDLAKNAYWGLVVELAEPREDGGRAGWWAVTELGEQFVLGKLTVPMYAKVYDGRVLGLVGDPIDVRAALGEKFNYEELMARAADGEARKDAG